MPVFIVTHRERTPRPNRAAPTYTFVTDGIHAVFEQAEVAAGGKDVLVVGGANFARQYLEADLLDEVHIHLIPILLGDGVRQFQGIGRLSLQLTQTVGSSAVTHLVYGVESRTTQW